MLRAQARMMVNESPTPFAVQIAVRGYELDSNGHLNRAVYLQYAEHARWECLRAAGIEHSDVIGQGWAR